MNSVQELQRNSLLNRPRRAERSITIDGQTATDLYEQVLPRVWAEPKPILVDSKGAITPTDSSVEKMMTYWALSSTPITAAPKVTPAKAETLDQVMIGSRRSSFSSDDAYLALAGHWSPLFDQSVDEARATEVPSPWEAVQRDLISLQTDWEGTEHTAPSEQALRDLDTVISVLPMNAVMPDVEIDDGNGEITLAWRNLGGNQFISIVIPGNQSVMFLAQLDNPVVERVSLTGGGDLSLFRHFQSEIVARVLE